MEVEAIAIAVAVVSGAASFVIGRKISRARREKKAQREVAAVQSNESRQVRRARERRAQQ